MTFPAHPVRSVYTEGRSSRISILAVIIGIGSTIFREFIVDFGGTAPRLEQVCSIALASLRSVSPPRSGSCSVLVAATLLLRKTLRSIIASRRTCCRPHQRTMPPLPGTKP